MAAIQSVFASFAENYTRIRKAAARAAAGAKTRIVTMTYLDAVPVALGQANSMAGPFVDWVLEGNTTALGIHPLRSATTT